MTTKTRESLEKELNELQMKISLIMKQEITTERASELGDLSYERDLILDELKPEKSVFQIDKKKEYNQHDIAKKVKSIKRFI